MQTEEKRSKIFMLITVEVYKAVVSCLLIVFTPQECPENLASGDAKRRVPHACEYTETVEGVFDGASRFNRFVLTWNFVTLFVIIGHYWMVWKREKFLVEFLQDDDELPDTNLKTIIAKHPTIDEWFTFYNRIVLISSTLSIFFLLSNFVLSGFVLFRDFYAGFRTVSVYISNFLLISSLVWKGFDASYDGIYEGMALSSLGQEPVIYNTIDIAHIHDDDVPEAAGRVQSLPVQPQVGSGDPQPQPQQVQFSDQPQQIQPGPQYPQPQYQPYVQPQYPQQPYANYETPY